MYKPFKYWKKLYPALLTEFDTQLLQKKFMAMSIQHRHLFGKLCEEVRK